MKPVDQDKEWLDKCCEHKLPGAVAEQAIAFQIKLLQAQHLPTTDIAAITQNQMRQLINFAVREVPYYREAFSGHNIKDLAIRSPRWSALPVLTREDLQSDPQKFRPQQLPAGHRAVARVRSSGSTGTPVEVDVTQIFAAWQKAFALRSAIWGRREFGRSLAVIRKFEKGAADWPDGLKSAHWADAEGYPFKTGPRYALTATGVSGEQHFEWLERMQPDYLLTYPSILRELLFLASSKPGAWTPKGVSTLGETVDDDLRKDVKSAWGIPINDVYSAEELGAIAIQCPSHGKYHIQTESVLVEIVDGKGRSVAPGKQGRVLVTSLTNFSMPLIRYEIGDEAILGNRCKCGRSGPVLETILGRKRGMLHTPKGRFWPSFGTRRFRETAPISSMQFRQIDLQTLQFRYVAEHPLTPDQQSKVEEMILAALPVRMNVHFEHMDKLERAASGKFEIFISDIE